MRLERPRRTERIGAVRIHELARVIELDSGAAAEDVRAVERDMVVVVPCKNEQIGVIEGVLSGIPHDCLIVLVSNSDREPADRYEVEWQTAERFCRSAERAGLTVHQRDPGLAAAMKAAGMPDLLDGDGLVRHGKGEGMLVGLALAALTGRRYVGYVDADNYVPGAVNEYCKAYAAGLHAAGNPYAMVRISWASKPKLRDGRLFFSRRGRTSEVTNEFLNRLFGAGIVATGNAGEHAFTLELGLRLRLAGGFAVEPFELLDLLEQFGGPGPEVDVLQIETRNPHFHENRGEDHVHGMRGQALNALYHSPVTPPDLRAAVREFLVAEGAVAPGTQPPRVRIYPPVGSLALDVLADALASEARTLRGVGAQSRVRALTRG
jgi:mannosyl-3-phosphoglycerate synthase